MRFDAYAALSELRAEGGGRANHAKRAKPQSSISTNSTFSTCPPADIEIWDTEPFSTYSIVQTAQSAKANVLSPLAPDNIDCQRRAALPTIPPTCAACGKTDWLVTIAEPDGRRLHVVCWKGEDRAR